MTNPGPSYAAATVPTRARPNAGGSSNWGASSVGVSGGVPKCSKTWLGLGLALLERAGRRHRTVTGW